MNNIIRLGQLLSKETLTVKERREGVTIAQAIFGHASLDTLDSAVVTLRTKKIDGVNDISGLAGRQIVVGAGRDSEINVEPETTQNDNHEFIYGGSVYAEHTDSAGRIYYTRDGQRIKNADYKEVAKQALSVKLSEGQES